MRIYLAGPLGFSEAGKYYQDHILIPSLKGLGHVVVNPWELVDPKVIGPILSMPFGVRRRNAWRRINPKIGAQNVSAIESCDVIVAVLDGVDVDSGTSAEIGFAFARNKKVFGYRGDFRLSADNEGLIVNLQVEYFIRKSGGAIVNRLEDLLTGLPKLGSKNSIS